MKPLKITLLTILTLTAAHLNAVDLKAVSIPASTDLPQPIVDADYYEAGQPSEAKVELGRFLFFDKILSGNKNISCATCHHPDEASADGLALSLGEGAVGLGAARRAGDTVETAVHGRVPRNSPALFNVGAAEFTRMYHDGRVETDPNGYYEGGFITPAKWKLPAGLDNVLAAQAMFPVTSPIEMAGQKGENSIADARSLNNAAGPDGVWAQLGERLQEIPEYVELFQAAFPERVEKASDISFVFAANAIAAWEADAFRADDSPFDRYLRDGTPLPAEAAAGMNLFYGKAGCDSCHSGKFQTDHEYYAIAMPQLGPGKEDGTDASYWRETGVKGFVEDYGRGRVTVRAEDNFKFRTPSLRNVELTGPWGHAGSYTSLDEVVRHHANPTHALATYTPPAGLLPPIDHALELTASGSELSYSWLNENRLAAFQARDTWAHDRLELRQNIADANELAPVDLTETEVAQLVAFLGALTDDASRDLRSEVPNRVPSGLEVAD